MILINNQTHLITENLLLLLESLYDHHAGPLKLGWLWVDAICIDQENMFERNHQVLQMKEVYTRASKVITWLGSSHYTHDRELFETFKQLGSEHGADFERTGVLDIDVKRFKTDVRFKTQAIFDTLASLFQRSYWQRIWIIQEIALASEVLVLCGKHCTPLLYILISASFWSLSSRSQTWTGQDVGPFMRFNVFMRERIRTRHNIKSDANSLPRLMQYFAGSSCALLHDKVYALLGLAENVKGVCVDYGVSPNGLFLGILESSSSHTTLEDCYGVADALHVAFRITPMRLVLFLGGSHTSATSSKILLPYLGSRMLLEVHEAKLDCGSTMQVLFNRSFTWVGVKYPMRETGSVFSILMDRYRAACLKTPDRLCSMCRCPLCQVEWPSILQSEIMEDFVDEDYSAYGWLSNDAASLSNRTDIPYFFLVFKRGRYMATIADDPHDDTVHGLAFRDPYHYSWKVKTSTDSSFRKTEISVRLPFISALILLAHLFPKDVRKRVRRNPLL